MEQQPEPLSSFISIIPQLREPTGKNVIYVIVIVLLLIYDVFIDMEAPNIKRSAPLSLWRQYLEVIALHIQQPLSKQDNNFSPFN